MLARGHALNVRSYSPYVHQRVTALVVWGDSSVEEHVYIRMYRHTSYTTQNTQRVRDRGLHTTYNILPTTIHAYIHAIRTTCYKTQLTTTYYILLCTESEEREKLTRECTKNKPAAYSKGFNKNMRLIAHVSQPIGEWNNRIRFAFLLIGVVIHSWFHTFNLR